MRVNLTEYHTRIETADEVDDDEGKKHQQQQHQHTRLKNTQNMKNILQKL